MTHWYHLQKTKTAAAALALMLVSSSWTSVKAQISLNVSQTTLGAVIQKIQKQSKYQFTYDDNLSKMQVNAVQVKNGKVEDVLNKLLKNKGVSYVIKDGIIYLKKKEITTTPSTQQPRQKRTYKGTLLDENKEPLIGATILVKGTNHRAVTDMDGNFTIETDEPAPVLQFTYLGYKTMDMAAKEGHNVNAQMLPDSQALKEVVVTALGIPGHRGCMVGNNSASVVADAYLSGLRGYDAETLWQAVVHGANAVHPEVNSTGRHGFEYYNKLGYVPYDVKINESVARTLEYAYDDWCIYQFGKALGKSKKELKPFAKRAMNYEKVFDRESGLMRGRLLNGKFQSPFNPLKWGDAFTEGNAWHYTWSVFHDPEGLIRLMGGKEKFNQMLDSVFLLPPVFDNSYYGFTIHEIREMQVMNMGNYAHGNQPIQHAIYLYDYSGQPWKCQYWVRQVMDRLYTPTPDGYCGDEDNGQTSAWYVFSAMGFYPVCPGSGQYALGTPYFKSMKLHLENGLQVSIQSEGDGCYVDDMQMNGKKYDLNYLDLNSLRQGAQISFRLSEKPNLQRGILESDAPYSFSKFMK